MTEPDGPLGGGGGSDPVSARPASGASGASAPSKDEMELMRHSLGLASAKKPYRNFFAASEGHHDLPAIEALVAKGLMFKGRRTGTMTFYHVTDAGCALFNTTRAEAEA